MLPTFRRNLTVEVSAERNGDWRSTNLKNMATDAWPSVGRYLARLPADIWFSIGRDKMDGKILLKQRLDFPFEKGIEAMDRFLKIHGQKIVETTG